MDTADFESRAKDGLHVLIRSAHLEAAVRAGVESFFRNNPDEPRTAWAETIIALLVMQRLTGEQPETSIKAA